MESWQEMLIKEGRLALDSALEKDATGEELEMLLKRSLDRIMHALGKGETHPEVC